MEKQPLVSTILKAPSSLKDARYVAETLALQINIDYQNSKPERQGKTITRFKDFDGGFALYIPLKVDGAWKNCPIYKWTKTAIGVMLEYDPRVVTIN